MSLPEPVQIDSRPLVKGKNDGRKDKPIDIEIKDKEEYKGSHPSQGGEDRSAKQQIRRDFLHSSFLTWKGVSIQAF